MIDSPVELNNVWRRGGEILNSNHRVNISTVSRTHSSIYHATLSLSPLSSTLDSGQYTCESAITSSAYILYTDASTQVTLMIGGMCFSITVSV